MNGSIPESSKPIEPNNPVRYEEAIRTGRAILDESGSKAAACRAIYELIRDEPRDVIFRASIEGGEVTFKGSPTYFYNISRKFRRKKAAE